MSKDWVVRQGVREGVEDREGGEMGAEGEWGEVVRSVGAVRGVILVALQ